MKYKGAVYSGNIFLGNIAADTMKDLKRQASIMCNKHNQTLDSLQLFEINGKPWQRTLFRTNRLDENRKVVRGKWE